MGIVKRNLQDANLNALSIVSMVYLAASYGQGLQALDPEG